MEYLDAAEEQSDDPIPAQPSISSAPGVPAPSAPIDLVISSAATAAIENTVEKPKKRGRPIKHEGWTDSMQETYNNIRCKYEILHCTEKDINKAMVPEMKMLHVELKSINDLIVAHMCSTAASRQRYAKAKANSAALIDLAIGSAATAAIENTTVDLTRKRKNPSLSDDSQEVKKKDSISTETQQPVNFAASPDSAISSIAVTTLKNTPEEVKWRLSKKMYKTFQDLYLEDLKKEGPMETEPRFDTKGRIFRVRSRMEKIYPELKKIDREVVTTMFSKACKKNSYQRYIEKMKVKPLETFGVALRTKRKETSSSLDIKQSEPTEDGKTAKDMTCTAIRTLNSGDALKEPPETVEWTDAMEESFNAIYKEYQEIPGHQNRDKFLMMAPEMKRLHDKLEPLSLTIVADMCYRAAHLLNRKRRLEKEKAAGYKRKKM